MPEVVAQFAGEILRHRDDALLQVIASPDVECADGFLRQPARRVLGGAVHGAHAAGPSGGGVGESVGKSAENVFLQPMRVQYLWRMLAQQLSQSGKDRGARQTGLIEDVDIDIVLTQAQSEFAVIE